MDTRFSRLHETSLAGDVGKLKVLLDEDKLLFDRVLVSTSIKDNPLHLASHRGHVDFIKYIIHRNPELAKELASQFNEHGLSPLHIAVARGHLLVVKELLKVGSDLCTIQDKPNGLTPIHVAVNKGSMEIIDELTTASEAAMLIRTNNEETLFHLAVKANRLDVIEFLFIKFLPMAQQDVLNAFDYDGNTALHLAMAGAQLPVMTYLLSCEGIDFNPTNLLGFTPLDALIYQSSHEKRIVLDVAEKMRTGGGKRGKDLRGTSFTFPTNSTSEPAQIDRITRTSSPKKRKKGDHGILSGAGDKNGDAGILIVVATLVATISFQAALNPPGGTISMPYELSDTGPLEHNNTVLVRYNSTWFTRWYVHPYPAGLPVLLWRLGSFFLMNTAALFLSVSTILILLTGIPQKSRFMMELLVSLMWLAVFCILLAYLSFFDQVLFGSYFGIHQSDFDKGEVSDYYMMWYIASEYVSFGIFGVGSLWISIRVIIFLLRKADVLKGKRANWISKIRGLVKIGSWLKKVICIILIIGVVVFFVIVNVKVRKNLKYYI